MKGFLTGLSLTNTNLQPTDLLDKASLLMSLSGSANNLLHLCLNEHVQPSELLISDMNYLIALNMELAEQLIGLVQEMK